MVVTDSAAGLTREAVEQLSAARNEPDWMRESRLRAWQIFEMLPMPTRQDEAWRRTDISKLRLENLSLSAGATGADVASPLQLDGAYAGTLTHQNNATVDLTLEHDASAQGVIFSDLETAVREHPDLVQQYFMTEAVTPDYDKFAAFNGAFWRGGTFLYVPRNVEVTLPLRALYTLTEPGAAIFTHTVVVAEEGSRVSFVEEYASQRVDQPSLNAGVVEIIARSHAHVTFVTLQDWEGQVYDLSTQRAVLGRDSVVDWLVVSLGDGITRNNIEASLSGTGASAQMLGILWGHGTQHTDYHTVQDHVAPHTKSDLLYKGALADRSRSVFSGTIRVVKGAQGTDAYQANRSILLSPQASSFPSPNLEIEANEVRCTHGASIGKVDQDQLFYLMARGISREIATRMIVEGFFEDVLAREPVESIRANLRELIARKMDL